jgi:filamentous hemagglutinin family protein
MVIKPITLFLTSLNRVDRLQRLRLLIALHSVVAAFRQRVMTRNYLYCGWYGALQTLFSILLISLVFESMSNTSNAQAPITSSGLNTQVSQSSTNPLQYDITGGTRPGGGLNLFHSFGEFGVPTNHVANFLNSASLPTANILGRVTGGNPSNIFGTIQTTGFGAANLFLMNPAGIVFGPNAFLNVGGSVSFTTADYLRLTDGVKFNAIPGPQDALISTAPVAAFGFLGANPGAITVQGSQLAVSEGKTFSLVSGNIDVKASTHINGGTPQPALLSAPGDQINLVSLASPGEILTTITPTQIDNPTNGGTSFGTISFSDGARLDTSANTAGHVVIRGGQFLMNDASITAMAMDGPPVKPESSAVVPTIVIRANHVSLANGAHITADSQASARAGDIIFQVDTLTTKAGVNAIQLTPNDPKTVNGNLIGSDSRSPSSTGGAAGNITIEGMGGHDTAASTVLLRDTTITSRVFGGTPDTPRSSITINADALVLTNEGLEAGRAATLVATTIGPAPAGNIVLNVNTFQGNVLPDETPIQGAKTVFIVTSNNVGDMAGSTGTITISGIRPESTDAAKLVALNNTFISAGADGGTAKTAPGHIVVTADTLSVSNDTGIITTTFGQATTPAGNIALNVNTLRAQTNPNGTPITGKPQVFIVSLSESGQAGSISISGVQPQSTDAAKQVTLNHIELNTVVLGGHATITPATITVRADSIHISNNKNIKTDTRGAAPAGGIVFEGATFLADRGSKISTTSSGEGPGGNISIAAGQSVTLDGGTLITAGSTGPGNAGSIAINAGSHFLSQNSSLTTQASQASGGNITIEATDAIRLVNSQINTSVQGGPTTAGGNITLDPAVVTLQNSKVLAQAVQGQGGNINITAGTFLADQTSVVDASSQFGLSGNVNIQSPVSSLSGTLAALPNRLLQTQPLLNQRCAAGPTSRASSFIVAGRDMLPTEPGGWLLSPLAVVSQEMPQQGLQRAIDNPSAFRNSSPLIGQCGH